MSGVLQYTTAGLAELVSASNSGIKGAITHIAVGDISYTPVASQLSLQRERQRVPIADYQKISSTELLMAAVFDGDQEYEVRELGYFLESGTLLAVYSQPNTLLTYKSQLSSWLQRFTMDISPLPSNSVTVNVGSDNLNILMVQEMARMGRAQINNMTRHLKQKFKLMELNII